MAEKDTKGRWIDPTGAPIPPKYIDKVHKKRDALVEKLIKRAHTEQSRMAKMKKTTLDDIGAYLSWLAAYAGEDELNQGGNYLLTGFSGTKQVEIKVNKNLDFDERLQVAKQKIDKCIERWSEGANENLQVIIYDAFKVDQKGKVDSKRILGLRSLRINDQEWKDAMELITEAVVVTGTSRYLLFRERKHQGEWKSIRLDMAGV